MVILTLPKHLPLKLDQALLPGSQQYPHQLIGDGHIAFKQLAKLYHWLPLLPMPSSHLLDDQAELLDLAANVGLGVLAPPLSEGALLGAAIAILTQQGLHADWQTIAAEGVVFLVLLVFVGPPLPVLLQTFHRHHAHSPVIFKGGWGVIGHLHGAYPALVLWLVYPQVFHFWTWSRPTFCRQAGTQNKIVKEP